MKKILVGLAMALVLLMGSLAWGVTNPDLVIERIQVGFTKDDQSSLVNVDHAKDKIVVSWKITNKGAKSLGPFSVSVLQSSNWKFSAQSKKRLTWQITLLAVGQSYGADWPLEAGWKEGVTYLGLQVKSGEWTNYSQANEVGQLATLVVGNIRSADPCGRLEDPKWGIVTKELKNGRGRYGLTPAQYIVLASLENSMEKGKPCNPLILLVTLQNEQGLITKKVFPDLEEVLAKATGYGVTCTDAARWRFFGPQLISTTFQYALYRNRDHFSFEDAFLTYTGGEGSWEGFQSRYAEYTDFFNRELGTSFSLLPDSEGYYMDFGQVAKKRPREFIAAMQKLLQEKGSVLANQKLFQERATQSEFVDYRDTSALCTVPAENQELDSSSRWEAYK